MFKTFLTISFLFLLITGFSQGKGGQNPASRGVQADGVIIGKIMDDSTNKPIDYASIKLFSIKDSTLKMGIFTNADGKFNLEQVPYGNYYLKITYTGYETKQISDVAVSASIKIANIGTVQLKPVNFKEIGEVKVVGKLDVLKAGIDKKIYNVGQDLSVKGGSANDVLNNIPSVQVDQDGGVTLRGDGGVTILIDGRPSSLSGGNGKSLLDALPAGSIDRIEIVTNPSAKYDPDGTSGIINIVLKKNKLKGFNGLINGSVGSGNIKTGNTMDGSVSLSYRNSKFNVFGSYTERYTEGYRDNYSYSQKISATNDTNKLIQNRAGTDLNTSHTFRLGAEYYFKPRNVLSFSTTGSLGERNRSGDQWNSSFSGEQTQTALWKRYSSDPSQQKNADFNLNYKYDLKNDRGNLIVDVNQSLGEDNIQGYYTQGYYNFDYTPLAAQESRQQLNNKEKNNVTSAQLDFTYLLPKQNARIETGAKMIARRQNVNTYSEAYDTLLGAFVESNMANFEYAYDENIFSAYGIFGQQLKKFKYQAGVRLEKAYQIPNLISDTIRIVNDYFNFFPSAHIRYAITDKSEVSLSYSRRITRANSGDLNPFTSYADPFNLRAGNPYLQPEFINSFDLGYSIEKQKFSFTGSVFYRQTSDMITRYRTIDENNVSTMTMVNLSGSNAYGAEIVFVFKPYKWWRNTFSSNANYTEYLSDGSVQVFNNGGFNWNFKWSSSVEFWKRTATLQLNVNYNGPRVSVLGIVQRRGPIDISFEKTFKDGKWSLGARCTDILDRQGFYLVIDQPSIQQDTEFKWLTRRFYITFSYKFGKLEMSKGSKGGAGGDGGFDM